MSLKNGRKGFIIYEDYFNNEFEDLTDEQLGALIRGLHEYDVYGELTEKKDKIFSDVLSKTVYKTLIKNHDRAVEQYNKKTRNYTNSKLSKLIKCNNENNPTFQDLDELLIIEDEKTIKKAIELANEDKWKTILDEYVERIRKEKKTTKIVINKESYDIIYNRYTKCNIPDPEVLEDYDEEVILKTITMGNKECWKNHYDDYLMLATIRIM